MPTWTLPPAPRAHRRQAGLAVLALVLAVHAALLGLWTSEPGTHAGARPVGLRPLAVRQIRPPTGTAPPGSPPQMAAATEPGPSRTLRPHSEEPPTEAALATAAPTAHGLATAAPVEPDAVAGGGPRPDERVSDAEDTPAGSPEPGADEGEEGPAPPVYATRLPPPQRLRFAMQRGGRHGTAELDWAWGDGQYHLRLHSQLALAPPVVWASAGALDGAGVAPQRYSESRRGRELRAANFQREAGLITFSGPRAAYPLVPGAQDRLSWLVQLGAVLSANPELAHPGAQIRLFVVGTRGDARTWVFTVQAVEELEAASGRVPGAVHLLREPRRPYDTQAHVWLDPARHYLPVRLHLRVPASGEGTLMELEPAR